MLPSQSSQSWSKRKGHPTRGTQVGFRGLPVCTLPTLDHRSLPQGDAARRWALGGDQVLGGGEAGGASRWDSVFLKDSTDLASSLPAVCP